MIRKVETKERSDNNPLSFKQSAVDVENNSPDKANRMRNDDADIYTKFGIDPLN